MTLFSKLCRKKKKSRCVGRPLTFNGTAAYLLKGSASGGWCFFVLFFLGGGKKKQTNPDHPPLPLAVLPRLGGGQRNQASGDGYRATASGGRQRYWASGDGHRAAASGGGHQETGTGQRHWAAGIRQWLLCPFHHSCGCATPPLHLGIQ